MPIFIFTYLKVLFIGMNSKTLNVKNLLKSLVPFLFLIFISFFDTSDTYNFVLFFLVILLSSMSFMENKHYALKYTLFIIFFEIYFLFIIYGTETFNKLFIASEYDLTAFLIELLIVALSLTSYILLTKFTTLNETSNNYFEVNLGFGFITMIIFCTVIIDLEKNNIINFQIESLVYLIVLIAIIVFISGIASSVMFNNIRTKQSIFQSELNSRNEKLEILLSTMENQRIDFVHQLLINNDYDAATEYIDKYLENQTKNSKNVIGLNKLNNDIFISFIKTKIDLLNELNFTLNIKDSIEDLSLKQNKYLLEILGIIIDNAIEASYKSNQKFIKLDIYIQDDNTIFEITNSALQDDIKNLQQKISKKGSKGRQNGLIILDILTELSDVTIIKEMNSNVTFKLFI
jgi:hypothetical protein